MIVAALVCLLVVTSIVGSMLKNAVVARRELLAERDRRSRSLAASVATSGAGTVAGAAASPSPAVRPELSPWAVSGRAQGLRPA